MNKYVGLIGVALLPLLLLGYGLLYDGHEHVLCPSCGEVMHGEKATRYPATVYTSPEASRDLVISIGFAAICTDCWDHLDADNRVRFCVEHMKSHRHNGKYGALMADQDVRWLWACRQAAQLKNYQDYRD